MPGGSIRTAAGFAAAHREVFESVGSMAGALDDAHALRETGCPGWTVRDCVAHVVDLESILIGRARAEHTVPEGLTYIRNPPGAYMEMGVEARRGVPLPDLLDEYREVTAERLAMLDLVQDSDLEELRQGFFGMSKLRSFLGIRVFDLWSHEQDMRRALEVPGGLGGGAAAASRERMLLGIAHNVQERLTPAAGISLVLDVTGAGGAQRAITFDGERGVYGDEMPAAPSATLRLDMSTLTVLACGRADDPGARSRVVVEGDQNLAASVLEDLAVTP